MLKKFIIAVFTGSVLLFPVSASFYTAPFRMHTINNDSLSLATTRIYGGRIASEGQFKFMIYALIRVDNLLSQCSSALVSPKWILLAAHCLNHEGLSTKDVILVGGKSFILPYLRKRLTMNFEDPIPDFLGVQERRPENFYIHLEYNSETLYHDLALIKVNKEFKGNDVQPIALSFDKIREKKWCTILGWGLNEGHSQNFYLNFVERKRISTTALGCLHKKSGPFICLEKDGSGICQGDSGSPLVCDGGVWGVASHLISFDPNPDCSNSVEEYYAELHTDEKWINSVMSKGRPSALGSASVVLGSLSLVLWSSWQS